jgi:hypothetical protein
LSGQTVTIAGQDPAIAELRNGVSVDSFDTWSADRDRFTSAAARPPTSRGRWSALRSSTSTGRGRRTRTTAPCGSRTPCPSTGRRTATATGSPWAAGAPLGSTPPRGATRLSTTDAGPGSAVAGAGAREATSRVRNGHRRWSRGTAAPAGASRRAAGPRSMPGCRSVGATPICRRGAPARSAAGRASTIPTASPRASGHGRSPRTGKTSVSRAR